ncbi:hypothetical protein LXL04_028159 [Taraxacum kok-saghyz]
MSKCYKIRAIDECETVIVAAGGFNLKLPIVALYACMEIIKQPSKRALTSKDSNVMRPNEPGFDPSPKR